MFSYMWNGNDFTSDTILNILIIYLFFTYEHTASPISSKAIVAG